MAFTSLISLVLVMFCDHKHSKCDQKSRGSEIVLFTQDGIEKGRAIEISKLVIFYLNGVKNSLLKGY
jgi:hypothetical protein